MTTADTSLGIQSLKIPHHNVDTTVVNDTTTVTTEVPIHQNSTAVAHNYHGDKGAEFMDLALAPVPMCASGLFIIILLTAIITVMATKAYFFDQGKKSRANEIVDTVTEDAIHNPIHQGHHNYG